MAVRFVVRWLSVVGLASLLTFGLSDSASSQVNEETGAGAPEHFHCESSAVPHGHDRCGFEIERIPGVPDFSCARPANYQQRSFCGAVFSYEAHWCDRIRNAALKAECVRRTE
jgi:hypothetical protein